MANFRVTFADVGVGLGISIICLPILQFLPVIEQSRTEARIAKAYIDVRQIRDLATATSAEVALKEPDPWGTPYRIVVLPNGIIRAVSSGPNQSSPIGTFDSDDIYSDMTTNPARVNERRKGRRILLVLATTVGTWLLLTGLYIWYRRRKQASEAAIS